MVPAAVFARWHDPPVDGARGVVWLHAAIAFAYACAIAVFGRLVSLAFLAPVVILPSALAAYAATRIVLRPGDPLAAAQGGSKRGL